MNRYYALLALCVITFTVNAQQATTPTDEAYGKANKEDLEMKACDFEKDANAEILIHKAELYYDQSFNITMDYHERVKIFNDNGKDAANIKLKFYNKDHVEYLTGLQAETINLVDGKIEITKLDKKQIFTQVVNKYESALVFTMPNVKPGSIIEYKYSWNTIWPDNIPTWDFQSDKYPVRYSELFTHIPEYFYFSTQQRTITPYTRTVTQETGSIGSGSNIISFTVEAEKRVMVNLPSLHDEPYMSSSSDNLQCLHFHLTSFRPPYGMIENFSNTWTKVGENLVENDDFGHQLKRKLTGEEVLISAAKALKTDDEKIAYLFNQVKTAMKWNGDDYWFTVDGTSEAWDKKSGNSTEINLILYHLLKKSGVAAAMPMLVSTREHGKVNSIYTFLSQFNRAVVYIPVDSTKLYILDASSKYNQYSETPANLLNSSGLYLNTDAKVYDLIFIQKQNPIRRSVYITGDIKPDGKLDGTAQISCFSYNRINGIDKYKTDGEKKYIDYLRDDDNNLKISSLKLENMDVDTLPLVEDINFNLDLNGSDDTYIYFDPNIFTLLHKNPFLSETRTTDIDFGYLDNLSVNGLYKVPAGYKIDALPKNITMTMPDQSITFRRIVAQQEGTIAVRYAISYKKSIYFKENYPDFHEFYKKMYEMLNEQIVLKKG